jgi:hypothetical protein
MREGTSDIVRRRTPKESCCSDGSCCCASGPVCPCIPAASAAAGPAIETTEGVFRFFVCLFFEWKKKESRGFTSMCFSIFTDFATSSLRRPRGLYSNKNVPLCSRCRFSARVRSSTKWRSGRKTKFKLRLACSAGSRAQAWRSWGMGRTRRGGGRERCCATGSGER